MDVQLLPVLFLDLDPPFLVLDVTSPLPDLPEAALKPPARQLDLLAVEPHAVGGERGAGGDGGGGGEVVGVEGDADAVVDGEDERLVPLPPVLDDGDVGRGAARGHEHPLRLGRRHRRWGGRASAGLGRGGLGGGVYEDGRTDADGGWVYLEVAADPMAVLTGK